MTYTKDERFALRYEVPTAGGNWDEKVCHVKGKEKLEANKAKCKELGYKVVSVKKLYPFSTIKNQHNFELINNICFNRMYDIQNGSKEQYEGEYDRLFDLRDKAERFFCLPLPVAWLPYEEWKEAKELSMSAVLHREQVCIENGRLDLLQYCEG